MKYQFQFAGANVGRQAASPKKRFRMAVMGAVLVLAGLAYANYFFNFFPTPFLHPKEVAARPAATAATVAVIATTAQPATGKTKAAAKTATAAVAVATTTAIANTLPVTPVTPVAPVVPAPAVPVPQPVTVPQVVSVSTVPASVVVTRPSPVAARPVLERTPQEKLMLAGETAFQMTMDLATKYPDSYGFRAEDAFADAKLGQPMPIYMVDDSDRANYQRGEHVRPLLKESKQWAFPVTVNNRVACMVTVTYRDHEYVPNKGSKLLGMAWGKITERWPADEGYHPCIVVNSRVPGYFFTVPELPQQNMTDIVRLFDYNVNLSPADVILASWR